MRGAATLLLLAAVAVADPFAPARDELHLDDAAYARYVETLALLKEAAARDPAGSLERAVELLEPFGLAEQFEEPVKKALAASEEGPARDTLRSLYGHLLVAKGEMMGNVWVFGPNGVIQQEGLDDATKGMLKDAVDLLREAIRGRPKDARAREDLATALELLNAEGNGEEIQKLRMEATAIRMAGVPPSFEAKEDEPTKLRREAEALEQRQEGPDHAAALLLRKEALVRDFCGHTIPIEYDPALYGPISLLASEDLVVRNLTRTYRKRDGSVDSVPPTYHPAKIAQRVQIAEGLGRDPGSAAGAALLKILATSYTRDLVVEAAMKALVAGNHEAVRKNLPTLLAAVVCPTPNALDQLQAEMRALRAQARALGADFSFDETDGPYGAMGQALLVEAAAALGVKEAAPVLAALLPLDNDLVEPRGIAAALGKIGGPGQTDALLAIACDPSRDVYFRREAILALGRLAPERLGEVPNESYLEIALAAARYRAEPSETLKGRLLQGLGRPHEADDAARYLMELGVREAIPALETFLTEKKDHYAASAVRAARDSLQVNH